MKTYMFSYPDPVPYMVKNYPYFKFDGFTNTGTQEEWNMVILENDYFQGATSLFVTLLIPSNIIALFGRGSVTTCE